MASVGGEKATFTSLAACLTIAVSIPEVLHTGTEMSPNAEGQTAATQTASAVPSALGVTEDFLWARLIALVESSDDAIITKDLNSIVQTWNRGAERLFGYTADEMIGRPITLLIPPDRLGEEDVILGKLRRSEPIEHYETVRVRKDGVPVEISLSVSPIIDSHGQVIAASKIARDITTRKQLDAERERLLESERAARADAERAGRAKDEFLATLSHELRTPLNAILGWSQILLKERGKDQELKEGLEAIDRNVRVQAQLIEDLLDISRIISGKMRLDVRPLEIQEVIRAAVETVRPAAEARNIRLHVVLDPLAGPVRGDAARLQQCIWNLLSNAIKFSNKGGRVQVALERVDSHVEVSVADTGKGISATFLPHVFDRFSQAETSTTRGHGGLGLGLSIVRQLVELHGGRVRARSAGLGEGSTFTIDLPVLVVEGMAGGPDAELAQAGAGDPERDQDRSSLDNLTILVLDDEADSRAVVRRVLEAAGARVLLAGSATEAMELLSAHRFHMILSDIGMPGEDGYQFIRRVRALAKEQGGRTPAAALTAYARPQDRTQALRAGFQNHLAKPVEPSELVALVASLASRDW